VRKLRTPGSVRGVLGNEHPYRDIHWCPDCWDLRMTPNPAVTSNVERLIETPPRSVPCAPTNGGDSGLIESV
jgi:hypothetical protein